MYRNRFIFNNQTKAPTIQIYSKTLHVSGIFSAHHHEFSTVHAALVSFMLVLMTVSKQSLDGTEFHPDSAWKRLSKTYTKLTCAECTVENS
jgi:hypothetical protein